VPLTAGFGIIVFLKLTSAERGLSGPMQFIAAAVILFLAGEGARGLGLGLLPDYKETASVNAAPYLKPLLVVLKAYFNSYGWALMVCALAIGSAAGIQAERWLHASDSPN
jgi:hypothetical protein